MEYFQDSSFNIPTIKLCFGKPTPQCLQLALSLSSSEIIFERTTGVNPMFNNHYDISSSTTFDTHYGMSWLLDKTIVSAHVITDYVTIDNYPSTQSKIPFLLIYNTETKAKPKAYDGYLGLRKEDDEKDKPFEFYDLYFPNHLFKNYKLKRQNMLIDFTNGKEGKTVGRLSFGVNASYDKCDSEIILGNKSIGRCYVNSIVINDKTFEVKDNKREVITFDTLSNKIIAPFDSGQFIFDTIVTFSGGLCKKEQEGKGVRLLCNSLAFPNIFPNVYLTMGKAVLLFQWKHIFKYIDESDSYASTMIYQYGNDNSWIVGLPGLIDNIIYYDYDHMSFGTVPLLENNKTVPEEGKINNDRHDIMIILMIILTIGITIGSLYMMLIKRMFSNKN